MKTKQGISLIVLVITIIVMTILAGAIVLTLNNSGIINNASEAVEQTNLATVKELAQVAWASAYASGERTTEKLKEAVDNDLATHKVDTKKYAVIVREDGVDVILRGSWVQNGLKITDGKTTLEIGDIVNYKATGTDYEGQWRVLGASEYGELLIMSDGVDALSLGDDSNLEASKDDWLNAASKLDNVCKPYGKGKGAVGVRSVRVEDIDKAIGFDKTTDESYGATASYTHLGNGKIEGYGYEFESMIEQHDVFYYIEGTTLKQADLKNEGGHITNVTHTYYSYPEGMAGNLQTKSSKAYDMLFEWVELKEGDDLITTGYWLASPWVWASASEIAYEICYVYENNMTSMVLLNSYGDSYFDGNAVRAVVTLSPTIQLTGSSETGWSY